MRRLLGCRLRRRAQQRRASSRRAVASTDGGGEVGLRRRPCRHRGRRAPPRSRRTPASGLLGRAPHRARQRVGGSRLERGLARPPGGRRVGVHQREAPTRLDRAAQAVVEPDRSGRRAGVAGGRACRSSGSRRSARCVPSADEDLLGPPCGQQVAVEQRERCAGRPRMAAAPATTSIAFGVAKLSGEAASAGS